MTLAELSRWLRFSQRTIYKMLVAEEIPALKIGSKWRFDRAVVRAWLKQKASAAKLRLLVIDDEPMIGALFKSIFASSDHEVVVAANGAEGIRKLTEYEPDLVFLDLLMPGMDGAQVLGKIRLISPALPVIIITGYPESACVDRALEYGPVTIMKKPLSPEAVRSAVESAVRKT